MTAAGERRGAPAFTPLTAVLCARNRAGTLGRTLESLCAQTLGGEAFEVVVVDDGSTDGTREVVRGFEARLRLRYSHQRSAGIASARNHGILCARGLVVLFVDDDLADPTLLEAHLEAHRSSPDPRYAVVGSARLDASIAADPLLRFLIGRGWPPFAPADAASGEPPDFRHVAAGRVSWKRSFLLDFGFFNPAFRSGGEGPELAWRLASRGLAVILEPGATTAVTRRSTLDEVLALVWEEGRARRLVATLHADAAVRRWAAVGGAEDAWAATAGAYGAMVRSARELDALVRRRLEAGLEVEERERALLHRGYLAALGAARLAGTAGTAPLAGEV